MSRINPVVTQEALAVVDAILAKRLVSSVPQKSVTLSVMPSIAVWNSVRMVWASSRDARSFAIETGGARHSLYYAKHSKKTPRVQDMGKNEKNRGSYFAQF